MLTTELKGLIFKDFVLEWRQKHTLGGIVLYLVSTIFITYLSFSGIINAQSWNALFWIIMTFASLNMVLKSFSDENPGRKLYLYTLASPTSIILSKILINTLGLWVLGFMGYTVFTLFMGDFASNSISFYIILFLGLSGFSSIFTMVSAIAGQVQNSFTLMAILGFPLVLPLLLMLIKASQSAISGLAVSSFSSDLIIIFALIVISLTLSLLLFPYIWKD